MDRLHNLLLTDQRPQAAPGEAVIEHVNFTVADPERTSAMMQAVFGWQERWRGAEPDGRIGLHVGGAGSYVSLYPPVPPARAGAWPISRPFNHLGVVVSDIAAAEERVKALGLTPYAHASYEPGRRFYFRDENGIEYEVVSYAPAASPSRENLMGRTMW
ncbi:MAG: VOC family protein [Glycocaulis sp.]